MKEVDPGGSVVMNCPLCGGRGTDCQFCGGTGSVPPALHVLREHVQRLADALQAGNLAIAANVAEEITRLARSLAKS